MSNRQVKYLKVELSGHPDDIHTTASEIHKGLLRRGYRGLGYHFVIQRDGLLVTARALHESAFCNAEKNKETIGVLVIGQTKNKLQQQTLEELMDDLHDLYGDLILESQS